MNTDFSATTSQKTAKGATPFDEIVRLESGEQQRVEKELAAMQKEEQEVESSLMEKEKQADTQLREEARNELKAYKTSELGTMLKVAEKDASASTEKMESKARAKMNATADSLVKTMVDPNASLLSLAA